MATPIVGPLFLDPSCKLSKGGGREIRREVQMTREEVK
jgi:hypothetical protein